jgi:hypothetical protein
MEAVQYYVANFFFCDIETNSENFSRMTKYRSYLLLCLEISYLDLIHVALYPLKFQNYIFILRYKTLQHFSSWFLIRTLFHSTNYIHVIRKLAAVSQRSGKYFNIQYEYLHNATGIYGDSDTPFDFLKCIANNEIVITKSKLSCPSKWLGHTQLVETNQLFDT